MSGFSDYENYDGVALAALIAAGEVSATEVMDAAIARLERLNPRFNAVTHTFHEQARAQLDDSGSRRPQSTLTGVPFLLKDLGLAYAGQPLRGGSRLLQDFVPTLDATLTERYRSAGLMVLGKTNTPEFGLAMTTEPVAHGPTRNPWNLDYSAGGSSGGAAAAIAAGIVPLAHASDGGGSIRMPAANCGLFGLKPTRARTPMGPLVGEGWGGLAVQHCISRSVRDSATLLDLSHGAAPGDPYHAPQPSQPYANELLQSPGSLDIGLITAAPTELDSAVHEDCIAAAEHAGALCEQLGHHVQPAVFDYDFIAMREAIAVLVGANLRHNLQQFWSQHELPPSPDGLETITWLWSEFGASISAVDYAAAVQTVQSLGRRHAELFEQFDVLLSPVMAQPPLLLGTIDMMSDDLDGYRKTLELMPFTSIYNLSGCPAMSLPLYWNQQHLPIGVQFGAPFGDEATLFRLAAQLEQAQPWFEHRPDGLRR